MKITVLTENNSRIDNYLLAEPGFSVYIETGSKKILFDTGYGDVYLQNAKALNLDLTKIDDIVISHGHNDHTRGLLYFPETERKIRLTAHIGMFDEKFDKNGVSYGCPISKPDLEKKFDLNLTRNVFYLTDKLLFLGEIENNKSKDREDSALVYVFDGKLFIITGCSHSGIENIVNYAKTVTGISKIYGILGGFHLINKTEDELEKTAKFFKGENFEYLAPCHCCDLRSKIVLAKYNKIEEVCVGDIISV